MSTFYKNVLLEKVMLLIEIKNIASEQNEEHLACIINQEESIIEKIS